MSVQLEKLHEYNTLIDVRSPAEFAQDHLPGALSMPVLRDRQREFVGTLYKRDQFDARRQGARIVTGNISEMLGGTLADMPRSSRLLAYCWRGGMRSASLVSVLIMVGWQAETLYGGYRAYRAWVRQSLLDLPGKFRFVVLAGPTGSGKTALLHALSSLGVQTLDLEAIANHRGSLFGRLGEQPTQRMFESLLAKRLGCLNLRKPVAVEAESNRIGRIFVPEKLHEAMRQSRVAFIDARREVRAARLAREYSRYADAVLFADALGGLARHVPKNMLANWSELHSGGKIEELASSLLENHYDNTYKRSLRKNFRGKDGSLRVSVDGSSSEDIANSAQRLAKIMGA